MTAHRVVFCDEQRGDQSLRKAYEDARKGKGGMFLSNELLYHRDSIAGTKVDQLVLPRSKREEVLQLTHKSRWGGHLGPKKTKARIKYSFYWPGVERDVAEYCKTCHGCQIHSERRRGNRVPITPLTDQIILSRSSMSTSLVPWLLRQEGATSTLCAWWISIHAGQRSFAYAL